MCLRRFRQDVDTSDDEDDDNVPISWENWQSHTVAVRGSMDMPPDYAPWTSKANLSGVSKTPRCLDAIDVAYFAWLKQLPSDVPVPKVPRWCVHVDQGIERRQWGETPHTMLKGSKTYVFSLDRMLDGEDRSKRHSAHFDS